MAWKTCTSELRTICWGHGPIYAWPIPTLLQTAEPGARDIYWLGTVTQHSRLYLGVDPPVGYGHLMLTQALGQGAHI